MTGASQAMNKSNGEGLPQLQWESRGKEWVHGQIWGAELNPGVDSITSTCCGAATGLKGIVPVGSEDLGYKVFLVWLP